MTHHFTSSCSAATHWWTSPTNRRGYHALASMCTRYTGLQRTRTSISLWWKCPDRLMWRIMSGPCVYHKHRMMKTLELVNLWLLQDGERLTKEVSVLRWDLKEIGLQQFGVLSALSLKGPFVNLSFKYPLLHSMTRDILSFVYRKTPIPPEVRGLWCHSHVTFKVTRKDHVLLWVPPSI